MTIAAAEKYKVILSVGDTTCFDYRGIKEKTEVVADVNMAATILRWYTYRWRVEDYHKILKSGCQSHLTGKVRLAFPCNATNFNLSLPESH